MNVVFTSIDDYLAELSHVGKAKTSSIVRVTVEEADLSLVQAPDGSHGTGIRFVVVSGFHDDKYFYQGLFDCGTSHGRNDKSEREKAADLVEKIRQTCSAVGTEMRGGLWMYD